MKMLPNDSIGSIVTDPPYGLGFMGKAWDALPPGEEWAREALRVLRPGGHLLAFGGTRTWHRLAVAVEDAGFEIRDSIAWMYGSGFPKHRATLKPAFEPIVMGRKPYKGSLTANEAIHGTGALNIDDCRIDTSGETIAHPPLSTNKDDGYKRPWNEDSVARKRIEANRAIQHEKRDALGRWPANVVLDETTAPLLDEQSGGASRFFKVTKVDEYGAISEFFPREFDAPFLYSPKAPKKERPVVDGVSHATVKPLTLMRWLVRLVTPAGGTVLEPFAGSGTTVEACILEGFHCIAIEREAEYLPLIQARIDRQDAA